MVLKVSVQHMVSRKRSLLLSLKKDKVRVPSLCRMHYVPMMDILSEYGGPARFKDE